MSIVRSGSLYRPRFSALSQKRPFRRSHLGCCAPAANVIDLQSIVFRPFRQRTRLSVGRLKDISLLIFFFVVLQTASVAADGLPAAMALSFTGSTLFIDSGFIPPDTMGAAGPDHIVELINGRYSVYRKGDGIRIQTSSLDDFWRNAGTSVVGFSFDP